MSRNPIDVRQQKIKQLLDAKEWTCKTELQESLGCSRDSFYRYTKVLKQLGYLEETGSDTRRKFRATGDYVFEEIIGQIEAEIYRLNNDVFKNKFGGHEEVFEPSPYGRIVTADSRADKFIETDRLTRMAARNKHIPVYIGSTFGMV